MLIDTKRHIGKPKAIEGIALIINHIRQLLNFFLLELRLPWCSNYGKTIEQPER